ncbi:MAG: NADH-quinone oxidoreductase subunit NuoH, partial [Bacteroidota bacterium]
PFAHEMEGILGENMVRVLGFGFLFAKIFGFIFLFMWVRWTLPRFRYDQLMNLGWKVLLPLSILNIVLTGLFLMRNELLDLIIK